MYDDFLSQNIPLQKYGVRMGDIVDMAPFQGNGKKIKLYRTKETIITKPIYSIKQIQNAWAIPSTKSQNYELVIELVYPNKQQKNGIYKIREINGNYFKIDGVYTSCGYLTRGSVVDFGYNRMTFKKNPNQSESEGKDNIEDCIVDLPPKLLTSDACIMLEGETGTGKSRLAKLIHDASGKSGKFIHMNLSACAPGLLESELFGHIKGSFTGANKNHIGAFELANNGTLFLDEINSLSISIQTKLLLVLESMNIRPVGGESYRKIKTRFIFASGKPLEILVKEGKMRQDFYYRIKRGFYKELSPLRESPELLEKIMKNFLQKHGLHFSSHLLNYYKSLPWPGNIRQFIGHLERKLLNNNDRYFSFDEEDSKIGKEEILTGPNICNLNEIIKLEELKRRYVHLIFSRLGESQSGTAEALGISRSTLKKFLEFKSDYNKNQDSIKHQPSDEHKHLRFHHQYSNP